MEASAQSLQNISSSAQVRLGSQNWIHFQDSKVFGGTVYHASQHQYATVTGNVKGKKVVVIGTGNSGHDIAQNFFENGADVTMLQRSGPTFLQLQRGY